MSSGRLSFRTSRSAGRTIGLAACAVTVALTLTACGGDDSEPAAEEEPSDTTGTAGALTLNGEWPLTGETLEGDPPDHPVYVVKIDNTSASSPQVGIGEADMVVEELVEGGLTRLAVFYYSETPDVVGPVRSVRATDIGIVDPARAQIVAAGGAVKTINLVADDGITIHDEGSTGFYRDDSRSAPYNLFMDLEELADAPGRKWEAPPAPYLSFGPAADFEGRIKTTRVEASFSGAHSTNWSYSDDGWTRTDGYAPPDDDFTADNLLLLRVKVGDAGYLDPAGNPVPETYFYGKGQGVLINGDRALTVKWSKDGKDGQVELTTPAGDEVTVPSGHTFIELVPQTGGSVTLGK